MSPDISKSEVEKDLSGKGEFVQMDHLNRFLKKNPPLDVKKFIYLNLAEIYSKKSMFGEAAKTYNNLAINSITFTDKIKYHVKEAEYYIKAGEYTQSDEAVKKAITEANATERNEIHLSIRELYKRQAEAYERELRRNNAIKVYEKLISMNISSAEKDEIKNKLLKLYEKIGKFNEYNALKGADFSTKRY